MIKKRLLILLLLPLLFTSCGFKRNYDEVYGFKIDETNERPIIIDDNYRNYYEIFVRSFADSDDDGIGDLNGVTEKLDYLENLGFTGIWLMPINESPSYHKYDVANYYEIDNSYGDIDDLKNLIEKAHEKNIKVIIDLVMNHSSLYLNEFKLASDAYYKFLNKQELNEEEQRYYDYYCFYENEKDPNARGKTLYKNPYYNFYYEANFSKDMPEFNFDSTYVREDFEKIMKYYLDLGVDGFRLDAVLYYYLNNTQKNLEVLRWINDYVKSIKKDAYVVGESWSSAQIIEEYYSSGIDSFFYFPGSTAYPDGLYLNSTNMDGRMVETFYEELEKINETSKEGIPAPFIDNHDMSRYVRVTSPEKTKFFYGLLTITNGTTFTYYGDEVGMSGNNPPDQNVRTSIRWGEDNGKYDTDQLSGVTKVEYPYGTVKENIEDENSILNYYKKANYLRNKFPSISRGEMSLVKADKERGLLIISKSYLNEIIDIAINFKENYNIILDSSDINENKKVVGQLIVNNEKYIGELKDGSIILPSYSIAIFK